MDFLLAVVIALVVGAGAFVVWALLFGRHQEKESPYQKKKYLFDTNSEFALFNTLLELYGEKYHVFPQMNYSHLIEPKPMDRSNDQRYRNRIDRKSADFVLADKATAVPVLVIELDGSAHTLASKQKRDEFINDITNVVGLPLLHIKTSNLDKEFIKGEVEKVLAPK